MRINIQIHGGFLVWEYLSSWFDFHIFSPSFLSLRVDSAALKANVHLYLELSLSDTGLTSLQEGHFFPPRSFGNCNKTHIYQPPLCCNASSGLGSIWWCNTAAEQGCTACQSWSAQAAALRAQMQLWKVRGFLWASDSWMGRQSWEDVPLLLSLCPIKIRLTDKA